MNQSSHQELVEEVKQIRSNNRSLNSILTRAAIDQIFITISKSLPEKEKDNRSYRSIVEGLRWAEGYNQALTDIEQLLGGATDG